MCSSSHCCRFLFTCHLSGYQDKYHATERLCLSIDWSAGCDGHRKQPIDQCPIWKHCFAVCMFYTVYYGHFVNSLCTKGEQVRFSRGLWLRGVYLSLNIVTCRNETWTKKGMWFIKKSVSGQTSLIYLSHFLEKRNFKGSGENKDKTKQKQKTLLLFSWSWMFESLSYFENQDHVFSCKWSNLNRFGWAKYLWNSYCTSTH